MKLGVRDRRKLYLLSQGKCSKCETDLFLKGHNTDIAVECHISSHKKNYPSKAFSRYDSHLTPKERDRSYNNTILLCRPCHEIIDNPENTQYTIEELNRIKKEHEAKADPANQDCMKKIYDLIIKREKHEQLEQEAVKKKEKLLIHAKKLYPALQSLTNNLKFNTQPIGGIRKNETALSVFLTK